MAEFHKHNGAVTLVLDDVESLLLRQLAAELRALLAADHEQDDHVLDRLLPDAYEDPEDERAYKDLVGDDLVREKLRALDVVSTALGDDGTEVTLQGDDFSAWLACLTDLRLAIGMRLDVDEERMAADVDPRGPDAQAMTVLHWLGWIQEGLIRSAA